MGRLRATEAATAVTAAVTAMTAVTTAAMAAAVALAVAVSACGGARGHPRAPAAAPLAAEAIQGAWGLTDGSQAVMEIAPAGPGTGGVSIQAWTTDEGIEFRVDDVSWDGRKLEARFVYPRTGFASTSTLVLTSPDTLEGEGRGEGYRAHEIWTRLKTPPARPQPAR
jgi:hypothetical protein